MMILAWYQLGISLLFNVFYYGFIVLYLECTRNLESENRNCEVGLTGSIGFGLMLIAAQFGIQIYLGVTCVRFTEEYERENAAEIALERQNRFR